MTIKDQIWVNKDGTGKRQMMIDMSEAYPMMKMGLAQEMDKEKEDGEPEDESDKELMELFAKAMEEGKIDTLMSPPSDDKNNNPYVADQKVRLQIDDEQGLFAMTIIQDITDVYKMDWSETGSDDMMNLNESPSGGAEDNPFAGLFGGGDDETFPKLNLKKKLMTIKKKKGEKPEGEENAEMEQMLNMFAGKGAYTYIVHFPKKVKRISGKGVVKKDKKTIEVTIPLKELFNPESVYDISVKFK